MSGAAKQFGKVAVLMGGISAEREISLKSGAAIFASLQSQGVDAHALDVAPGNIDALFQGGFDRAFVALHGRWGEDGVVQGAMQSINLPYTGSGVLGCALAMDKVRSKQVWQANGLPTAAYKVLRSQDDLTGTIDELGLPLFLKPNLEGSSVGVGKVTSAAELVDVWQRTAEFGDEVLAEQFIAGPELTVAILGERALPVIRLQTDNEFYDFDAKYQSNDTQYHCPAGLSDVQEASIRALALEAFRQLDCSGWGRVDIMLDADDNPQLLEVNTVPGMTDHSLVPMAAAAIGLSFDQLVVNILEATL
ncbi:MAG: D-alanine--D-alanine ligase [Gammaproteobacteria bacterium]|nr:D-alanine--D-alanine ligase [Gammaproteobacteria bacterium]